MGIHSLDRWCPAAHAENEGDAQRSETSEHLHRLREQHETGRLRTRKRLFKLNNGGIFSRRHATLHVARSIVGKWL